MHTAPAQRSAWTVVHALPFAETEFGLALERPADHECVNALVDLSTLPGVKVLRCDNDNAREWLERDLRAEDVVRVCGARS